MFPIGSSSRTTHRLTPLAGPNKNNTQPEVYLEPLQKSMMELFAKTVTEALSYVRKKYISDNQQGSK